MSNMMDPLKSGFFPLTEEVYIQQKKLRKESKTEKTIAEEARDLSSLSPQAHSKMEQGALEDFKETASSELSQMDPSSENFLQEAIGKLVSSALEKEFGEEMASNKGFPAMKEHITRQLLGDPEKRVGIENFISLVQRENEIKKEKGGNY